MTYVEAKKDLPIFLLAEGAREDYLGYYLANKSAVLKQYQTLAAGSGYSRPLVKKYKDNYNNLWLITTPIKGTGTPVIKYNSESDYKTSGSPLGRTEKEEVEETEKKDFFSAANLKSLFIWLIVILSLAYLASVVIKKEL